LYQEKEWQTDLGLDLYDSEWRQYDPFTIRTTMMDPHAEDYYEYSPYSWVLNNPVSIVDPDGMDAIGICPTCPDTPDFKPYIDDPDHTFMFDHSTGQVSLLLEEIEFKDDTPEDQAWVFGMVLTQESAVPLTLEASQVLTVPAVTAGTVAVMTTALVFIPFSTGDGEMEELEKIRQNRLNAQGKTFKDIQEEVRLEKEKAAQKALTEQKKKQQANKAGAKSKQSQGSAEHTKNAREKTRNKHEQGQSRKQADKQRSNNPNKKRSQ
jgi:RHS repeat-associated protein